MISQVTQPSSLAFRLITGLHWHHAGRAAVCRVMPFRLCYRRVDPLRHQGLGGFWLALADPLLVRERISARSTEAFGHPQQPRPHDGRPDFSATSVAAAIDRYRSGEIDVYAADETIQHYHRAATELWKFASSEAAPLTPSSSPASSTA